MDEIWSALEAWGCDRQGALERFVGDEDLYAACLESVTTDENYGKLGKALEAGDIESAFDCAHTLKGVLANLGLIPLYEIAVRIVEPLRAGDGENLKEPYEELVAANERLKEILAGRG